jgi:hypothetical protein
MCTRMYVLLHVYTSTYICIARIHTESHPRTQLSLSVCPFPTNKKENETGFYVLSNQSLMMFLSMQLSGRRPKLFANTPGHLIWKPIG